MRLIHWKIDPPFLSLVDINEHQLSLYIHILILARRTAAQIHHGELLKSLCMKICLIGPQLKFMFLSLMIPKAQHCMMKIPAVYPDFILMNLFKTQLLHFPV